MVNRDIVFAKVNQIQNCLRRIQEITENDPKSLDQVNVQDIFVLNLQRAVQSTIDLAVHLVSEEGLGIPNSLKENFALLKQAKVISSEMEKKMKNMVGFRNVAVHDYASIEVDILKSVLKKDLADLREFYTHILRRYKIS